MAFSAEAGRLASRRTSSIRTMWGFRKELWRARCENQSFSIAVRQIHPRNPGYSGMTEDCIRIVRGG